VDAFTNLDCGFLRLLEFKCKGLSVCDRIGRVRFPIDNFDLLVKAAIL